ncbi:MAG: hypothetical protein LAT82_05265 [Nanoarchaeota archaeon]|nr:hypothetical protein [Nanoarchaeota archaeon]
MDMNKIKQIDSKIDKLIKKQDSLTKVNDKKIDLLDKQRLEVKDDISLSYTVLSQINSMYFNIILAIITLISGLYAVVEIINWINPNLSFEDRVLLFLFSLSIFLIGIILYISLYFKATKDFKISLKFLEERYDKIISSNNNELKKYIEDFNKLNTEINELQNKKWKEAFNNY